MSNNNEVMTISGETEICFVIMPISDQDGYEKNHFNNVYDQIIKPAIKEAGYNPLRADEDILSTDIMIKVIKNLKEAPMAVCDLSSRNPNVLYELGIRQAYDKSVVLIQDSITERIFDVSGLNTIEYNSDRLYESVIEAREKITAAIIATKNQKGNTNTLMKLLDLQGASIRNTSYTNESNTEALLQVILSDLQSLKKNNLLDNKNEFEFMRRNLLSEVNIMLKQTDMILERRDRYLKEHIETAERVQEELRYMRSDLSRSNMRDAKIFQFRELVKMLSGSLDEITELPF